MRTITFLLALFAGSLLSAQDYDFVITMARGESTATATQPVTSTISFNQFSSHYQDNNDASVFFLDSSFARQYTTDSSNQHLMAFDCRPQLRSALMIPFGIMTDAADVFFFKGEWLHPYAANVYDVVLIDNQTGVRYNMCSENNFQMAADLSFSNRFTLLFQPRVNISAFNATCFGEADGSVFLQVPQQTWSMDMFFNAAYTGSYHIAGNDTFISGLTAGTYTFVYYLNNIAVDTASAVIAGQTQVISAAVVSSSFVAVGQAVSFTNTSSGALTYLWNFGDGVITSNISPVHSFSAPGFYTVTLTAYNAFDCSGVSTYVIHVVPVLYSEDRPDRTDIESHNTERMGTVQVQSGEGQARIASANEIQVAQLVVYSVTGQLIYSGTGSENTFSYSAPGIYVAHITYVNGQQESKSVPLN
jgi:PKD repeat protein